MTQSEFTTFYPQFADFTPAAVLSAYLEQANARFSHFAPPDAEEARRLYVAHRLTLYARTAPPGDSLAAPSPLSEDSPAVPYVPSKATLSAAGDATSQISSRKVGEVQVTYSTRTSSSSSASQADLAETVFGLQLLSLLRLYGYARYFP